jgi:hypothetical protein
MVLIRIKQFHHFSPIITGDSFPFSVLDWDERTRVQRIPDEAMDLLGVVSFVHSVEVGMSGSVRLFQEFFGMRDIVDRILRDLQTVDNLLRISTEIEVFRNSYTLK